MANTVPSAANMASGSSGFARFFVGAIALAAAIVATIGRAHVRGASPSRSRRSRTRMLPDPHAAGAHAAAGKSRGRPKPHGVT
jgi:hypothetical protein